MKWDGKEELLRAVRRCSPGPSRMVPSNNMVSHLCEVLLAVRA